MSGIAVMPGLFLERSTGPPVPDGSSCLFSQCPARSREGWIASGSSQFHERAVLLRPHTPARCRVTSCVQIAHHLRLSARRVFSRLACPKTVQAVQYLAIADAQHSSSDNGD